MTNKWQRFGIYGGFIAENITQASARDVLADSLLELDATGFNPLLTVHDEFILETTATPDSVAKIMQTPPTWAQDLPLAVEITTGARYQKG
jgi:DNA polymerase bacteriophage-type